MDNSVSGQTFILPRAAAVCFGPSAGEDTRVLPRIATIINVLILISGKYTGDR